MKLKSLLAVLSVVLGFVGFTNAAQASYSHYNICYVKISGMTSCHYLPSNYRINGVRKPYCNRAERCRNSRVGFRLSRRVIRSLARYMDTSDMAPMAHATIYAKARY